jgi:predicted DNA-binding protein (UPF0251 family)
METVSLRPDELEALRLADLEGLYQEECAQRMGISRTTLSRTLTEARRKVTDVLINGKRLVVEPIREEDEADNARDRAVFPSEQSPESVQAPRESLGAGLGIESES